MKRVEEYIEGKSFAEFRNTSMVIDAVVRNFEIIGEAAKQIPPSLRKKYSTIPWKQMVGLRNLISHEYFGIEYEILWKICREQLPLNKIDVEKIVNDMKESGQLEL